MATDNIGAKRSQLQAKKSKNIKFLKIISTLETMFYLSGEYLFLCIFLNIQASNVGLVHSFLCTLSTIDLSTYGDNVFSMPIKAQTVDGRQVAKGACQLF